jgi:hypothetical protein
MGKKFTSFSNRTAIRHTAPSCPLWAAILRKKKKEKNKGYLSNIVDPQENLHLSTLELSVMQDTPCLPFFKKLVGLVPVAHAYNPSYLGS